MYGHRDVGLLLLFWLTDPVRGWWTVQETLANKVCRTGPSTCTWTAMLAAATQASSRRVGYATPGVLQPVFAVSAGELGGERVLVWLAQRSSTACRELPRNLERSATRVGDQQRVTQRFSLRHE